MQVERSEIEVVQHWERIIAALRGSQLARVWFEYKTGLHRQSDSPGDDIELPQPRLLKR